MHRERERERGREREREKEREREREGEKEREGERGREGGRKGGREGGREGGSEEEGGRKRESDTVTNLSFSSSLLYIFIANFDARLDQCLHKLSRVHTKQMSNLIHNITTKIKD